MGPHVCPWWVGYALLLPLRRLVESPRRLLAPHVREGMTVLEVGPGMGFFTLELARLVGASGRVVAVDIQERMLATLRRRAARAGVAGRVETRLAAPDRLGVSDLAGRVDLAVAIHVVHETPSPAALLAELADALRPGGALVLLEPNHHVARDDFEAQLAAAGTAGLEVAARPIHGPLSALLRRR